ncbi:hypothetical protein L3Q82_024142, partial [Scortum barcoo]
MLFIDYSSAFNTIVPSKLVTKLRGPRAQQRPLPLLYSLFTHDCVVTHSSNIIVKFADDTTVIGLITGDNWPGRPTDRRRRQREEHAPLSINGTTVERASGSSGFTSVRTSPGLITLALSQSQPASCTIESILTGCMHHRLVQQQLNTALNQVLLLRGCQAHASDFYSAGVDCFGPYLVKIGRRTEKRWGVIFKCLTTRAVHIELLNSMDVDAFLLVLHRFIARRGQPKEVLSDCCTNFRGAERELREAFAAMEPQLKDQLTEYQIDFKFNPLNAPHFGGAWEREVHSIKSVTDY